MLRVFGWNKPGVTKITVNRQALAAADLLASVVDGEHTLWLTLPTVMRGETDFTVE